MSKPAFQKRLLLRGSMLVWIVLIDLLVVTCNWTLSDEAEGFSEYDVKAAFLFNFIRFVDWSDRTRDKTDRELILGIAGEDHFGNALNSIRDRKIKGRTLVIIDATAINRLADCDILFISSSEKERLPSIMAALKDLPILTVSELEGFAERGGMINFIIVGNRVHFEVNPDAAKRVGIHISSQLLKLARIVTDE